MLLPLSDKFDVYPCAEHSFALTIGVTWIPYLTLINLAPGRFEMPKTTMGISALRRRWPRGSCEMPPCAQSISWRALAPGPTWIMWTGRERNLAQVLT